MKLRIYNENGKTRIVEVTNRGIEITHLRDVESGEFAEMNIKNYNIEDAIIRKVEE